MKTCLVITDSVGCPRENPFTPFSKTWLGLLEPLLHSKGFAIYTFQKKGLSTDRIKEELADYLQYVCPDLLILQIGIVDCSPRALKESELAFIHKIPIVRNIVRRIVKRFYQRISQYRNISYTEISQFEANLRSICATFSKAHKIVIPIGLACQEYIKKSPLIGDRIFTYNMALKKVFGAGLLYEYHQKSASVVEQMYTADFYHLNDLGHRLVYEALLERL